MIRRMPWMLLGMVVLALTACATATPPPVSPLDRWRSDLREYEEQSQKFTADIREMLEEFQALRADPDFPGVEEKIKDLAARVAGGDQADPKELLRGSFYTMSLGELTLFPRFLALSTRVVTLEATQAELQLLRLELRFRRPADAGDDSSVVDFPVTWPLSCLRYLVGNIEFANCR